MIELVRTRWERGVRLLAQDAPVLWTFTATIFLSALLLFSVQPIFAKLVLPKLGGTPAVWAVSMCFFQAALLAGYCYAHALNRWAGPRVGPMLHITLLLIACLALPFGLPAGAEPPAGDAYLWLIQVLAVGVGLPFFAVSANAPLLQAWFARSGHPHARDPYFLYGASNLGSLLALLAYPVTIEPLLGLAQQANVWTFGFVVLGIAIATSATAMMMAAEARGLSLGLDADAAAAAVRVSPPLTLQDRLAWIGLAFVPSGLLVAYTTHLTTDIASAPFLWVLPLAAFLATFVVVFRDTPLIPEHLLDQSLAPLIGIAFLSMTGLGLAQQPVFIACSAVAVLLVMLIAHRALYLRRPDSSRLTEFYIWMSFGGVLGGIFAAIVAPQIFNTVVEYPLLLLLGLVCRPKVFAPSTEKERRDTLEIALVALAAIAVVALIGTFAPSAAYTLLVCGFIALIFLMLFWREHAFLPLVLAAAGFLGVITSSGTPPDTFVERSFFGVHRVAVSSDGKHHVMFHGTTIHGAERVFSEAGVATGTPVPATYYYPGSPMAEGFGLVRAAQAANVGLTAPGLRVGVVGLGAGSLACYATPTDRLRYFEIDPVVVKIAKNPEHFRFLSKCQPNSAIILGDARLSLAKEADASFDYLVIDAFSSDAVPVHLLTAEALAMYLAKVGSAGLLALHVTNRFMDLDTVAAATARSLPGVYVRTVKRLGRSGDAAGLDSLRSWVVFVTRSREMADRLAGLADGATPAESAVAPWTDDYSDVVGSIWRNKTAVK